MRQDPEIVRDRQPHPHFTEIDGGDAHPGTRL
jgi:hypothetical protein